MFRITIIFYLVDSNLVRGIIFFRFTLCLVQQPVSLPVFYAMNVPGSATDRSSTGIMHRVIFQEGCWTSLETWKFALCAIKHSTEEQQYHILDKSTRWSNYIFLLRRGFHSYQARNDPVKNVCRLLTLKEERPVSSAIQTSLGK